MIADTQTQIHPVFCVPDVKQRLFFKGENGMFAYYWIGDCSNVKHITVLKEDHRDLYSGGTLIAEFEIKGVLNELKLTKHISGKVCELEQAIYWAKQLLKFLKEQKVI